MARNLLLRHGLFLAVLVAWILPGDFTCAEVLFTFTYYDVVNGNGRGFDDPVLGADRRAAVELVASQMGRRIGQDASVEIGVAPSQVDGTGFIGIASANFLDTSPGIRDGEVYRRIVLGEPDSAPTIMDAGMAFDFGYTVQLSGVPAEGVSYFPDVVRHELTHALGYGSHIAVNGTGYNGTSPDTYSRFDAFVTTNGGPNPGSPVVDAVGNLALDAATFASAYAAGLVFDGPITRATNGGLPLRLYPGSPTHSLNATDVMYPSPAIGYARDDWTPLDVAVLKDLGYEILDSLPADFNMDGTVNLADFNILKGNFGATGATNSDGDANLDGTVNLADFNILKESFGESLPASVPEPATCMLAILGVAAIICYRAVRAGRHV